MASVLSVLSQSQTGVLGSQLQEEIVPQRVAYQSSEKNQTEIYLNAVSIPDLDRVLLSRQTCEHFSAEDKEIIPN